MVTREWMLVVNRAKPHYNGIQVNSLGYLGLMFARDADQVREINEKTPLEILSSLGVNQSYKSKV